METLTCRLGICRRFKVCMCPSDCAGTAISILPQLPRFVSKERLQGRLEAWLKEQATDQYGWSAYAAQAIAAIRSELARR